MAKQISFVVLGLLSVLMIGCWGDPSLNIIRPTFSGTLTVDSKRTETKELHDELLKIGEQFGLKSHGVGKWAGKTWQMGVFCRETSSAGYVTTLDGRLVLFHLYRYGFKRSEDYERYKSQMLKLMKRFGTITQQVSNPEVSPEDLAARRRQMGEDQNVQCENQWKMSG